MKTFSKIPSESTHNNINCSLCGCSKSSIMWKKSSDSFVKCKKCGLVFQNPQPLSEELVERYDNEYFDYEIENEESFFKLMELGLEDLGFYKIEAQILNRYPLSGPAPSFLDIGCATGRLLYSMRERGWSVSGVEVCESSAMYGIKKRGLDIHIGPLETAGINDSSIDVVHCSHLIEHLTDPSGFVSEAARILRPGGLFIVVTPDISGFQARLFGSAWRSAIADHMYLFSRKTLMKLMKKHGFKIVSTASWGGLAAGTAPEWIKKKADRLVKPLGAGDVVSIMGMI